MSRASVSTVGGMLLSAMRRSSLPPGGGGPGRAVEPFPLGAAGFVDVDVGVDQSADQHLVGAEVHDPVGFECGVQRFDGDDATVAYADRASDFAGRRDHAGRAEYQV